MTTVAKADHNAKTDDFGGPVSADHFECRGKRRIFLLGEVFVGDHAGGDDGDEGVKHDDQSHAHAYTQRNVLLRIDGFFGSGGDHIEAEEREEHERGSGDDAGNAVNAGVMPVAHCHNGCSMVAANPDPVAVAGSLGGMNGVKFSALT